MARQGAMSMEDVIRKKVSEFRHWRLTKLGKRSSRFDFTFKVMTYNILSQTAVNNHRYLYRHCSPAFLLEDYRISRILPEILNSQSDIICLQEVEELLYYEHIHGVLQRNGFQSVFKRGDYKTDGCAICWRTHKFKLTDWCGINLKCTRSSILDRDNVALIAVLRPLHARAQGMHLNIATTHLLFNPRRGDVKLAQLRLLFAELNKLCRKPGSSVAHNPIILCGDFNIQPFSPLYHFLEKGYLNVHGYQSGDLSGQRDGINRGRGLTYNGLYIKGIDMHSYFENRTKNKTSSENSPDEIGAVSEVLDGVTSQVFYKTEFRVSDSNTNQNTKLEATTSESSGATISPKSFGDIPGIADVNGINCEPHMSDCVKNAKAKELNRVLANSACDDNSRTSFTELNERASLTELNERASLQSDASPNSVEDSKASDEIELESNTNSNSSNSGHRFATNDPVIAASDGQNSAQTSSDMHRVLELLASSGKELAEKLSNQTTDLGFADPKEPELVYRHTLCLEPAYKYTQTDKDIPVTSMTGYDFNNVDHIFYSVKRCGDNGPVKENRLHLLSVYGLMQKDEFSDIGGLPNAHLGSDHLYLMSHFALCFK